MSDSKMWLHALGPARKVSQKAGKPLWFTVAETRFSIPYDHPFRQLIKVNTRVVVYYEEVAVVRKGLKKTKAPLVILAIRQITIEPTLDEVRALASR
jgi:hypothetical protein